MKTGETHHLAKFSDEDVEECRMLRDKSPEWWTYARLTDYFGCAERTISGWLNYTSRVGGTRPPNVVRKGNA